MSKMSSAANFRSTMVCSVTPIEWKHSKLEEKDQKKAFFAANCGTFVWPFLPGCKYRAYLWVSMRNGTHKQKTHAYLAYSLIDTVTQASKERFWSKLEAKHVSRQNFTVISKNIYSSLWTNLDILFHSHGIKDILIFFCAAKRFFTFLSSFRSSLFVTVYISPEIFSGIIRYFNIWQHSIYY